MSKISKYLISLSFIISAFIAVYFYVNDIKKDKYSVNNMTKIGGSFSLINQDEAVVTDNTYLGKYVILYFGFSRCKQICPFHLDMMTEALNKIKNNKLIGLFVTVDPDHDTPEVLKKYQKNYTNKIEMLTGSKENILAMRNNYKVFVMDNVDEPEDINHSVFIYLLAPNGKLISFKAAESTEDLMSFLNENIV
ncbi:SCO family protein [Anaplasmataceae bacterium AB001_6]|nr:SCO family protein [Anaplasmataceae bacterium AB001_6]